jgi:uncharacterized damage-inducible protein DinB
MDPDRAVSPPLNFLLPEFDHEMAVTRQLLERLPDLAFDWKPHERSFTLGGLATHLAVLPHWGRSILDQDTYDLQDGEGTRAAPRANREEVLAVFDANVRAVRDRLATMAEAELSVPWTLRRGGQTLMRMPRYAALRRFLIDHLIHHRGQLTVYLRLQNVPLPPLYGPSADEHL